MPFPPSAAAGRPPWTAGNHAVSVDDLETDAAVAEAMAAEWEADGRPAFAARRRALARRLRARAAAHRRDAGGAGGDRA